MNYGQVGLISPKLTKLHLTPRFKLTKTVKLAFAVGLISPKLTKLHLTPQNRKTCIWERCVKILSMNEWHVSYEKLRVSFLSDRLPKLFRAWNSLGEKAHQQNTVKIVPLWTNPNAIKMDRSSGWPRALTCWIEKWIKDRDPWKFYLLERYQINYTSQLKKCIDTHSTGFKIVEK